LVALRANCAARPRLISRLFDLTYGLFHRQLRGRLWRNNVLCGSSADFCPQQAIFWQSTGQYEPPILERVVALTYLLIGKEYIWIARLYNSLFWVIGGLVLYLLAYRMATRNTRAKDIDTPNWVPVSSAMVSLAYYLVLPFSVQASRSFQPDPGMVTWIVLSSYALYRWTEERSWKWSILAGAFAGMAVLTKALAFYIVFFAALAMIIAAHNILHNRLVMRAWLNMLKDLQAWCIGLLMVTPTVIYYMGRGGRAGEYFTTWTLSLLHLLIEPLFYLRWLNLVQQLFTPVALVIALLGIVLARGRMRALLVGLWSGCSV
jgi:hypothetical protein